MDAVTPLLAGVTAVVLLSGFVKIATALSIVRYGLGLQGSGFGVVVIVLSLALGLMTFPGTAGDPVTALMAGNLVQNPQQIEQMARPSLERLSDAQTLGQLSDLDRKITRAPESTPPRFTAVVGAYLLTQLKVAFQLGLLFIIPFLVIDLLVANVMLAVGITQIPAAVVAFPAKVLLFVVLNGWDLVAQKLLNGFGA